MATITVSDVPAPRATLCWKQGPTMERCDRRKGHGGPHIWDLEGYRVLIAAHDTKVAQWAEERKGYPT